MTPMERYERWWNFRPWWWRLWQMAWTRLAMLRYRLVGGQHPIEDALDRMFKAADRGEL